MTHDPSSEPDVVSVSRASRLLSLLPVIAALATFGFFAVDKPTQAKTVLSSTRGLATMAAIVLGYVLLGLLFRRVSGRAWIAPVASTVVILGLAGWLVRPYYVDETVNRMLVEAVGNPAATPAGGPPDANSPTSAVRVSSGEITGIDHDARGRATLIRTAAGAVVVRLEDFDIEGSPDPQVYVARGEDVRRPAGVKLGRLPGNRGAVLDIAVPPGTAAGPGWTVLVWCRSFGVPIANATQSAA